MVWEKILAGFFVIATLFSLFSGALVYTTFDERFYTKTFEKHKVYETVPQEEVEIIKKEILAFFKGKETLETSLLNEKEKAHMQDVKTLVKRAKFAVYAALIFALLSMIVLCVTKNTETALRALRLSAFIAVKISVLMFIVVLTQFLFTPLFTKLHELLYANDLWMLDPEQDALVKVFSEQFFIDFTTRIIIIVTSIAVILFFTAWSLLKMVRDKTPKNKLQWQ